MKFNLQYYLYVFLGILLNCSQLLHAQENETKAKTQYCQIAILAIGSKPSRRFKQESSKKDSLPASNNASILLPPRKGETPPHRLYFVEKNHDKQQAINLSFNNSPSFITLPANQILHLYQKVGTELQHYITVAPLEPESSSLIVLLSSSLSTKKWKSKPKQRIICLTGSKFINKELALVNLSKRTIKSNYQTNEESIKPGKSLIYSAINKRSLHRISARYGRENKVIINSAIKFDQKEVITLYIFYNANPNTNDGRTVGLRRVRLNILKDKEN